MKMNSPDTFLIHRNVSTFSLNRFVITSRFHQQNKEDLQALWNAKVRWQLLWTRHLTASSTLHHHQNSVSHATYLLFTPLDCVYVVLSACGAVLQWSRGESLKPIMPPSSKTSGASLLNWILRRRPPAASWLELSNFYILCTMISTIFLLPSLMDCAKDVCRLTEFTVIIHRY